MHIAESVLSDKGRIDPHKIDLMGRMGRFYYARASGAAVEEIVQEVTAIGIGFDGLPHQIRHSKVLTGNELGQLASLSAWPSLDEAQAIIKANNDLQSAWATNNSDVWHQKIKQLIWEGDVHAAAALAALIQA
jgi:hypothetical protein